MSSVAAAQRQLDQQSRTERGRQTDRQEFVFAVPDMHCAACISAIEHSLAALPEVAEARVNLSNRRVRVEARSGTDPAALIEQIGKAGFSASQLDAEAVRSVSGGHAGRGLLLRLGVAGFGFSNVMIFSVAVWSGADGATRDLLHWLSALIAIPVIGYSAQPFFVSACKSLARARLNMDVPIALAIFLASAQSVFETALGGPHAYYEAALALTFFLLAGRFLDLRTRAASRSAALQLSVLEPDSVTAIQHGCETAVSLSSVAAGDRVVVRPGDRIPLDGIVREGACETDSSFFTGESRPQLVREGDAVCAGQFVVTGRAVFEATHVSGDSSLRKLVRLIELAESAKSRYTSLADKAASVYAPAVHLLALAAFAGWMFQSGDVRLSLNIAVAVLIITCPCALGLAVPAVSVAATGRLFGKHLLVKEADAAERLAAVDAVILDKTGTLTTGSAVLDGPGPGSGILAVARGLAETSHHPFAKAVAEHARQCGVDAEPIQDITEIPGLGIEGKWNGELVRLGRAGWAGGSKTCRSSTFLKIAAGPAVEMRFADQLRDGASECVSRLRELGLRVIMVSGDSAAAVEETAGMLGISEWHAEVLPADKLRMIEEISRGSRATLMIGDGLNDAAAMSLADVSMAPSTSVDVTRVAAGIVIMGDSLASVAGGIMTARLAKRRILENFAIAAAYNAVAVPVAMFGFATPLAAAVAMSTSSIAVTLNSMRLR